jgi:hypothetical protein
MRNCLLDLFDLRCLFVREAKNLYENLYRNMGE